MTLGTETAALVYRAVANMQENRSSRLQGASTYVLVDGPPRLALYRQSTATH